MFTKMLKNYKKFDCFLVTLIYLIYSVLKASVHKQINMHSNK